jgi:antitoxin MazE
MKIKVRKIGNSVGVLLPKAIVDQCSIKDEVNLEVKGDTIIIQPVPTQPRQVGKNSF